MYQRRPRCWFRLGALACMHAGPSSGPQSSCYIARDVLRIPTMSDTFNDARLAVSFGASFLGFPTHLGFLRGLVAGGWRPAAVAGSSAGAIIAGLYAAGLTLDEIEAAVTRR